MKSATTRLALVTAAAIALATAAFPAVAGSTEHVRIAPLKGVSLDVGTKNAVAYFVQENGACNVTVTLAEAFSTIPGEFPTSTRVTMPVAPGTSSRIDTAEGTAMSLSCAAGASALDISMFERTAYVATQQNY